MKCSAVLLYPRALPFFFAIYNCLMSASHPSFSRQPWIDQKIGGRRDWKILDSIDNSCCCCPQLLIGHSTLGCSCPFASCCSYCNGTDLFSVTQSVRRENGEFIPLRIKIIGEEQGTIMKYFEGKRLFRSSIDEKSMHFFRKLSSDRTFRNISAF